MGQLLVSGTRSSCSSRERNMEGSICFKLTNEVEKCILKIMVKVDTLPSLALSNKRKNIT